MHKSLINIVIMNLEGHSFCMAVVYHRLPLFWHKTVKSVKSFAAKQDDQGLNQINI